MNSDKNNRAPASSQDKRAQSFRIRKIVEGEKIYLALMNILSASLRRRLSTFTMDAFALSHNQ